MASTPNSLNPIGPTTKMMPEGSRKVCVLNGSRQLDQVVKGDGKGIARPGQAASLAQQQQRSASKGGGISL